MKKGQRCVKVHARRHNPLERLGFKPTPAGRWIDPKTGRSLTAMEAWDVAEQRHPEKFLRYR